MQETNKVKIAIVFIIFPVLIVGFISCRKSEKKAPQTTFTRIDSLTEIYLNLQDSMLNTWNLMMKDENEKLEAVNMLLEDMLSSEKVNKDHIKSLLQRVEQLNHERFTQKTMENPNVVEEYDFASNALITEVIEMAESHPNFISNVKWQNLADQIKSADQRVFIYREEYDKVVNAYNKLLDEIGPLLPEIDAKNDGQKKPSFSPEDN